MLLDEFPVQAFKGLGLEQIRGGPIPATRDQPNGVRPITPFQIIKMQNQGRVVGAQFPDGRGKGIPLCLEPHPGKVGGKDVL